MTMTPGLHIIQSNRLELLVGRMAKDVADAPLASTLAPELVVVQQRTVGNWLDLQLARSAGIAANMRYLSPGELIWELYRSTHPDIPSRSPFDPEILQWRIIEILNDPEFVSEHAPLKSYLEKGNEARKFDLSSRLAGLFDRYLVYRMDWLAKWESGTTGKLGPDEKWQAALWHRLTDGYPVPHRGKLFESFLMKVETREVTLPERITVFGISSLSPAYITILRTVAKKSTVNLYLMNPCRQQWGGIASERKLALTDIAYTPDILQIEVPHALLASFGKQGQDFVRFVSGPAGDKEATVSLFTDPGSDTLLHGLQKGMLDLAEEEIAWKPADESIRIHSCHTPMREVEVLHDRLMDMFENDRTLLPSDVMVLAPDINTYAPYIEAVFPRTFLPYDITDRSAGQVDVVVEAWIALLGLSETRFEADAVIDLLRLDPLHEAFGIEAEDIETLSAWVAESGIRWGRDAAHKRELNLPESEMFTWSWGLERMALGVALPRSAAGSAAPLYEEMLPYDAVEGQGVALLDRLVRFIGSLRGWIADLEKPKSIAEWTLSLNGWLDTFFPLQGSQAESRERIRDTVREFSRAGGSSHYVGPLHASVIKKIMLNELGEEQERSRFPSGGITFCSMKPMRSLPFRVIYLLGVSEKEFPRDRRPPSFDLLKKYYRYGDRSGRLDDRYLFLELLLSARDRFVISYVGEDVRSGKTLPMSTVLNELLDFLGRLAFAGPQSPRDKRTPRDRAEEALLIRHPLQAFSTRYFDGQDPRLFSYSRESCAASGEIGRGTKAHHTLFPNDLPAPLEEVKRLRLTDLCRFYKNPAQYLLQRRLNVYLTGGEETLEVEEPLIVGSSESRSVTRGGHEAIARGRFQKDELYRLLLAGGKLPVGLPGEYGFESALTDAAQFLDACKELYGQKRLDPVGVELAVGKWTIDVELQNLTPAGCFRVRTGKLRAEEIISFWIEFLAVLCVHPGRSKGSLTGTLLCKDTRATFSQVEKPLETLKRLVEWYEIGLTRPLHFFPNSALEYARSSVKGKDPEDCLGAAEKQWDPDAWSMGTRDCEDEYYRRVFFSAEEALTDEFITLTTLIAVPAISRLSEEKLENKEARPKTSRKRK